MVGGWGWCRVWGLVWAIWMSIYFRVCVWLCVLMDGAYVALQKRLFAVCMVSCVHIYILYMCVCERAHVCGVHVCVCKYVCTYVCACVCMQIYVLMCVYICVHMCVRIHSAPAPLRFLHSTLGYSFSVRAHEVGHAPIDLCIHPRQWQNTPASLTHKDISTYWYPPRHAAVPPQTHACVRSTTYNTHWSHTLWTPIHHKLHTVYTIHRCIIDFWTATTVKSPCFAISWCAHSDPTSAKECPNSNIQTNQRGAHGGT